MSGLYDRAESFRSNRREEAKLIRDLGMPEEESRELLEQIDKAVSREKSELSRDRLSYDARKDSRVLPLLVNIAAFLVILLGAFVFFFLFRQQESAIVSSGGSIESVEGGVIAEFKKESRRQLKEKESEIRDARRRLEELSRERNSLQNTLEERIREREIELRASLEEELEQERERLRAQALSEEEIQNRLAELAAQKEREYRENLSAYRESLNRELDARERDIAELTARLDMSSRQRTEIGEQFEELVSQSENRRVISDRIDILFGRVAASIDSQDYLEALGTLDTLDNYISRESIASLPYMRDRIARDTRIIEAMRALLEGEPSGTSTSSREDAEAVETEGIAADSGRVDEGEVSRMIDEGDARFESRDFRGALETYTALVESYPESDRIPAVADRIETSLSALLRDRDETVAAALEEAEAARREAAAAERGARAAREAAAAALREAEAARKSASSEPSAPSAHSTGTVEENRDAFEALQSVREIYAGHAVTEEDAGERTREEVYSLLQAKVRMRKIMNSEEIRAAYPDLYESMQDYYDAYGEEQWEEGSASALARIVEIMDILADPEDYSRADISEKLGDPSLDPELFERFLNRLEALLD